MDKKEEKITPDNLKDFYEGKMAFIVNGKLQVIDRPFTFKENNPGPENEELLHKE